MLRELAGKGCVCGMALIFGIFAGNELLWSISIPKWVGVLFGGAVTLGTAWFLLSGKKPRA